MSNEPTFQDLLADFSDEIFVGRVEHLALFTQLFTAPRLPFLILAVAGQGGVGKSTLLEQFRHIAIRHHALTALVNEDYPTILEVLTAFAEQFRRAGHPLTAFDERNHKYRELKEQVEADKEAPKGMLDFVVRSAARIGIRSLKRLPIAGDAVDVLLAPEAEDRMAEETSAFAAYVARKFTNKDERVLVLEPEKELTGHFLQGLTKLATNHRLLLYFDTYEQTSTFLDEWLRDLITGKYGAFSTRINFVIAGRYRLGQHWMQFGRAFRQLEIDPFTLEEARTYLIGAGITDAAEIAQLIDLSERLPVLLSLLVAAPGAHPDSVATTAVDRFLQGLSADQRQAALLASIPRFFNQDILALLLGDQSAAATFAWLSRAHFVYERNNGWAYHAVVRNLLLRYDRLRSPQQHMAIHTKLAAHYHTAAENPAWTGVEKFSDPLWRKFKLEYLYHALSISTQQYLHHFIINGLEHFAGVTYNFQNNEALGTTFKQMADLLAQVQQETDDEKLTTWTQGFAAFASIFSRSIQQTDIDLINQICAYPSLNAPQRATAYLLLATLTLEFEDYRATITAIDKAIACEPQPPLAYRIRGRAHRQTGDYVAALADFTQAIALQPDDGDNYYWRGRTYRETKDYPAALADFTQAIALQPDDDINYLGRGVTHFYAKNYPAALADFTQAIALQPDDGNNYNWRGATYLETKDYPTALADFTQATALQPDDGINYQSRGVTHFYAKDYPAALADLTQAITLLPDNRNNYYWRGRTHLEAKAYPAALADLTQAITLLPDNRNNYYWRGLTHREAKDYPAALADFTQAIALQPDDGINYQSRGVTHFYAKDYPAALADLTQAIALQPDNGNNYHWRGRTHLEAKAYPAALADFTQAIALQPDKRNSYYWRGRTHRDAKDYLAALADFTQAIALQPDDGINYYWRGRTHRDAKDYLAALADFTQAIALQPDDGINYQSRGVTHFYAKDYPAALADLTQAITLLPDNGNNYYWRGRTHRDAKDYPAALADLTQAITLLPDKRNSYYWQGRTHLEAKAYPAALADFTQAIALEPDNGYKYYWRALAHLLINDHAAAQVDLAQAIALATDALTTENHTSDRFSLALYELVAGNPTLAHQHYQDTVAGPARDNDIQRAIDGLDRYLTFFPSNAAAQAIRQQLQAHLDQRSTEKSPTNPENENQP